MKLFFNFKITRFRNIHKNNNNKICPEFFRFMVVKRLQSVRERRRRCAKKNNFFFLNRKYIESYNICQPGQCYRNVIINNTKRRSRLNVHVVVRRRRFADRIRRYQRHVMSFVYQCLQQWFQSHKMTFDFGR